MVSCRSTDINVTSTDTERSKLQRRRGFCLGQVPNATQADGSIFFWKNVGDVNFSQVDIPTTDDGVGTGFESIASLQQLPANVDTLKIRYGGSGALRTLRFCVTTTTTTPGGDLIGDPHIHTFKGELLGLEVWTDLPRSEKQGWWELPGSAENLTTKWQIGSIWIQILNFTTYFHPLTTSHRIHGTGIFTYTFTIEINHS